MKKYACFFCTTPFQVMSALLLTRHEKLLADLYIVPQFKNAGILAKNIRKCEIFEEVVVVNTNEFERYKLNRFKIFVYLGIIRNYIGIDKIARKILIADREYTDMYISSKANVGRLIMLYLYKHNQLPTIHHFDDGESSYNNKKIIEASRYDKYIRRLIFGNGVTNISAENLYLYAPELYFSLNPESEQHVLAMPIFDETDRNILNEVFGMTEEKQINEQVVIIDIKKDENISKAGKVYLEELYTKIADIMGTSNVVIKKHPRDMGEELNGIKYYKEDSIPFELFCMNENVNNKILISAGSTAIVLPKILFGKEPQVILLSNLVQTTQSIIADSDGFYKKCKEFYSVPDTFAIPETEREFFDILENVRALG